MPKLKLLVGLVVLTLAIALPTVASAQNKLYQRYVANDTDLYEGHPDRGGTLILDRRGNPVFADAGSVVVTDGMCYDAWCPLYEDGHRFYLWGGNLCPFVKEDAPPVDCTKGGAQVDEGLELDVGGVARVVY